MSHYILYTSAVFRQRRAGRQSLAHNQCEGIISLTPLLPALRSPQGVPPLPRYGSFSAPLAQIGDK